MDQVNADQFRRNPYGHYVRGRTWLVWASCKTLGGFTLWGTPDGDDAQAVVELFDVEPRHPLDILVDAHRVQGVEPVGFGRFSSGLAQRIPGFQEQIKRIAVVLPDGWVGAVVAGVQHVVAPRWTWQTFRRMQEALAFLGTPEAVSAASEVTQLVEAVLHEEPLVGRVRAWLETRQRDASIHDAALELGVSVRSLQRALSEGGTTYRDEVLRSRRARLAKRLVETDDKLEAVAHEEGFSSLQHFSTQFKRWEGLTPSEYRARARARSNSTR